MINPVNLGMVKDGETLARKMNEIIEVVNALAGRAQAPDEKDEDE